MFLTIIHGLLLIALVASVTGVEIEATTPASICPDGTLEGPNHNCFKFISDSKTFSDAEHSCISMGGHLAIINTSFVNNFVAQTAGNFFSDDFWIGANVYTKLACKPWVWTDLNKLVVYTDWANGQPSDGETGGGQCALVSILDGTWSAVDCSSAKPYVCEVPRVILTCPDQWTSFNLTKSCYKVFIDAPWEDARNFCQTQDANLTSIHSQEENDFVISIAQSGQSQPNGAGETWIGLFTERDDNTDWKWSDGSPVNYINWAPGRPVASDQKKCGGLMADPCGDFTNHFDNLPCSWTVRNYVCKKLATTVAVV